MGNEDKATCTIKLWAGGSLSTWAVGVRLCLKGAQLGNSVPSSVWKKETVPSRHQEILATIDCTSQLLLPPSSGNIYVIAAPFRYGGRFLAFVLPLSLFAFHF